MLCFAFCVLTLRLSPHDRQVSGDGSAAAVPRLQRDEERELGEPPVHQGGPHHPACENKVKESSQGKREKSLRTFSRTENHTTESPLPHPAIRLIAVAGGL